MGNPAVWCFSVEKVTVGPTTHGTKFTERKCILYSCKGKCLKPYYGLLFYQNKNESNVILIMVHVSQYGVF